MTCVVELEPPNERRGMRVCTNCNRRSLKLLETETHDVPAERGNVMVTRTFTCTTNGCGTTKRTLEVCAGDVAKRSTRGPGNDGGPGRGGASTVEVETEHGRITLKI